MTLAETRAQHDRMANAIRVLAMDAVELAKSGHPGLPMGAADIATVQVHGSADGIAIASALKEAGLTASTSEALRMIAQGGVKLDGEKVADKALKLASGASVGSAAAWLL